MRGTVFILLKEPLQLSAYTHKHTHQPHMVANVQGGRVTGEQVSVKLITCEMGSFSSTKNLQPVKTAPPILIKICCSYEVLFSAD